MKVVLFDIDGTLVKAGGAGRKALNRAAKQLYGYEDVCSTFSLAGRMDLDNFRLAIAGATKRKARPEEVADIEAAYLQFLPEEVETAVKLGTYSEIAGVSKLVEALAKHSEIALGLGTGNVEQGARIKLGPSGMLKHFKFGGFGRDAVSRAQMLRVAVRRAQTCINGKVPPKHVFAIGDTPRDVQAGRKAGFKTGAVLDGFGDENALVKERPDFLARDFQDTQKWLQWILS